MQCGLHVFEEHFNEEKKKKNVAGSYSSYKEGFGGVPKVERSLSVKLVKDGHLPGPSE